MAALNANATIIKTSDGNTYDVQSGGTPSPFFAFFNEMKKPETNPSYSVEFFELKYKSRIPLDQKEKVRAEAADVFAKYQKATGSSFTNKFYEAASENRFISMYMWVGSEKEQTVVMGQNNGVMLEKRITPHHYIAVNPDGPQFSLVIYPQISYWIRGEKFSKELPFVKDSDRNFDPDSDSFLDEMFGVRDSNLWVAFSISEMRKESVDLVMTVFNDERIVHKETINGSVRTNLCNQTSLKSYSVQPAEGNAFITFNTTNGITEYDVKSGVFRSATKFNSVKNECK